MKTSIPRACARLTVITVGVAALSLAGALAAGAHVSVSADTTAAGSYALLTFSVPHGCDGSPTTKIAMKIPEQVAAVTPTVNPNWDVETVTVALDPPVTDEDGRLTDRVDQVVYTAKTPLAPDLRDALVLSMQIPDIAGQRLQFPVVQTCEAGETAWIEQQVAGQPEPDHPAPALEVTAATGDGHDHAASDPATDGAGTPAQAATSSAEVAATTVSAATESTSSKGLAIAGLVAGVLGLLAGGIALVRSRRP